MSNICFLCHSVQSTERSLQWDYIPRQKDVIKHGELRHMTTLEVQLCDDCYALNQEIILAGWDWWDAIDGIDRPEAK
jgi:hypothetical protein